MYFLGADPSLRHTGLVLVDGGSATVSWTTIETDKMDILSAFCKIRSDTMQFLASREADPSAQFVMAMERQLRTGWNMGGLFMSQIAVLEAVESYFRPLVPWVLFPFPNQLKSYLVQRHGVKDWKSKKAIIGKMREVLHLDGFYQGKVTEHEADAYFLAHLAREVVSKTWEFKIPVKQATSLVPTTAIWRQ